MKTSANGVALVKKFEGLELTAYKDVAGIWTIGYGHTGPDVKPGLKISEQEADNLLRRDLSAHEDAVTRAVSAKLNQNEFDALVSFVYNIGAEAFRKSTARRRLNGNDRVGAAEALTWFNKATIAGVLTPVVGLTRRRAAERALFLEPVVPPQNAGAPSIAENSRVKPVEDAPRRPNLAESRSIQGAAVAGGAGVAATNMGQNSASELHQLEKKVEEGKDLTLTPPPATDAGGSASPDAAAPAGAAASQTPPSADKKETTTPAAKPGAAPSDQKTDQKTDQKAGQPTTTTIQAEPQRPSAHEQHAAQSQIQFALLVLIVLSVAYIIFARIDDWWRYRR